MGEGNCDVCAEEALEKREFGGTGGTLGDRASEVDEGENEGAVGLKERVSGGILVVR